MDPRFRMLESKDQFRISSNSPRGSPDGDGLVVRCGDRDLLVGGRDDDAIDALVVHQRRNLREEIAFVLSVFQLSRHRPIIP